MARQIFYVSSMIEKIKELNFIDNLIMLDEVHFHIKGYINKENCKYLAAGYPHKLHKRLLHSQNVTVWCVKCNWVSFQDDRENATTVTSELYVDMLDTFLAGLL